LKTLTLLSFLLFSSATLAKVQVLTTIDPITYLVEKIGGDAVAVSTFIKPGSDPHHFTPKASQIKDLHKGKLLFTIGADFERTLLKRAKTLPELSTVRLDKGFSKLKSDDHNHQHGSLDPHIWLSPNAVKRMVKTIERQLTQVAPEKAGLFKENRDSFLKELAETESRLRKELKPLRGETIFVYHSAYQYFLKEFGLREEAVEMSGKEPTPRRFMALLKRSRKSKVKVIFVSPTTPGKVIDLLEETVGLKTHVINPLKKSVLENYLIMGQAITDAYKKE
jgi:zinc transport system substrate-binding protein